MPYTVSQVAKLARLSVRALHHYDEIGLLVPSARTEAGYRLYGEADLERLQQILFFRELAFPLEEIRRILDDPEFDRGAALRMQRALLEERASHARALIDAVDRALEALEGGAQLKEDEMFEAFDPSQYEDEVRERWGDTEAYRESARRTKGYTKDDWRAIRAEQEEITRALAAEMESGAPASAETAMDLAERHRLHIDRRFYPCSPAMHRGLGEMYVEDSRFRENYERVRAGLAVYLRDAIRANTARRKDET
jgi:MerR family transcriptional regulator, thiopeptide resistance regulator